MQLRSVILYLLSVALFVFGNKSLWRKLKSEWTENSRIKAQQNKLSKFNPNFEVQKLRTNTQTQNLENPSVYFQTIRLSNDDMKKAAAQTETKVEKGNQAEHASESK